MLQTPTVYLSSTTRGNSLHYEGTVCPRVECLPGHSTLGQTVWGTFYTRAECPGGRLEGGTTCTTTPQQHKPEVSCHAYFNFNRLHSRLSTLCSGNSPSLPKCTSLIFIKYYSIWPQASKKAHMHWSPSIQCGTHPSIQCRTHSRRCYPKQWQKWEVVWRNCMR